MLGSEGSYAGIACNVHVVGLCIGFPIHGRREQRVDRDKWGGSIYKVLFFGAVHFGICTSKID